MSPAELRCQSHRCGSGRWPVQPSEYFQAVGGAKEGAGVNKMWPSVKESDKQRLRQPAKAHLDVQVGDVVVVEIPKTFQ